MTDEWALSHPSPSLDAWYRWRVALDRLTERDRLILCLRDDRRLPSARIGAMLGLSTAEVDQRYARAVQTVQRRPCSATWMGQPHVGAVLHAIRAV
jgi:DNA-directed RNA polymerase specialized sigma24 family protein